MCVGVAPSSEGMLQQLRTMVVVTHQKDAALMHSLPTISPPLLHRQVALSSNTAFKKHLIMSTVMDHPLTPMVHAQMLLVPVISLHNTL
jgi:hypothetical protein